MPNDEDFAEGRSMDPSEIARAIAPHLEEFLVYGFIVVTFIPAETPTGKKILAPLVLGKSVSSPGCTPDWAEGPVGEAAHRFQARAGIAINHLCGFYNQELQEIES